MRLSEPIEKHGFFWLPGDAENQVPGVLRISESGEVILEVSYLFDYRLDSRNKHRLGSPLDKSEDRNINRIVGIIEGDFITLDECVYVSGRQDLSGGVSTSTIRANFAFIGVNYDREKEVTFSELTFSVDGLDEWLSISGFQTEHGREDISTSIHFSSPQEIVFNLSDSIELKFTFSSSWTLPFIPNFTEARITQKAHMSLVSKELRPFEDFLNLVFKLNNFLCFAINKTVSIDSITGYSSEITEEIREGQKSEIPIKIYYRSDPYSETKPEVYQRDMLFCYPDISDQCEGILTKWIKNYEIAEPAFNLYFSCRSGVHKYLDGKFLLLAQGIETLHRRNSQETQMPEDEFRNLIDTILNAVPDDEQRRWIDEKLKYANELSLRKRMGQMIEPFKDLYGNKKERNSFISKVVDTRNYLTHYDKGLINRMAQEEDLITLYLKLEALFQLHFLKIIGMKIESIYSIINKNRDLNYKLRRKYLT